MAAAYPSAMISAISTGGYLRLCAATAEQIRKQHEAELAAATCALEREAVEKKIRSQIKKRLKEIASPYSLWDNC